MNERITEMDHIIEEVHISEIRPVDTIIHDGQMKTVCGNNIKHDTFMGTTIFGDSYHLGYKKVLRVTFKAELARRQRQLLR